MGGKPRNHVAFAWALVLVFALIDARRVVAKVGELPN